MVRPRFRKREMGLNPNRSPISPRLTHGVGWCAPQQGACKLTLNVKDGVIQEALVETLGCSGMTHSAAMAAEILPGKNHSRSVEFRPCLRCDQRRDA